LLLELTTSDPVIESYDVIDASNLLPLPGLAMITVCPTVYASPVPIVRETDVG
jgi:hypothetical protein